MESQSIEISELHSEVDSLQNLLFQKEQTIKDFSYNESYLRGNL